MSYQLSFKKPKNVRIVDMCIYIDDVVYQPNLTETEKATIYQYLYFIIYSLTIKHKVFNNIADYDTFALMAATKVYMRLVDPRQFTPGPDERKLNKITSVLNYIKLTLVGMRVDYQKENFKQRLDPNSEDGQQAYGQAIENTRQSLATDYDEDFMEAIELDIKHIPTYIRDELRLSPYRKDPLMLHRLYLSCLITLTKRFTLANNYLQRLDVREKRKQEVPLVMLSKLYAKEKEEPPVVWKISPSLIPYIGILCNKIQKRLEEQLQKTIKYYDVSDDDAEKVMLSAQEPIDETWGNIND